LFPNIRNSSANYDYLNSRIRTKASSLLKENEYASLACGNLRDVERFLLETPPFAESFQKSLVMSQDSSLKRIETVVAETETSRLIQLRLLAEGEAERLISTYLSRADLINGRLVLRSVHAGKNGIPEPYWHTYGSVSASFFSDLWKTSSSVSDCIEYCRSESSSVSSMLVAAFSELGRTNDLLQAERVLLLAFLHTVECRLGDRKSDNTGAVEQIAGMMIDVWNLAVWLRRNILKVNTSAAYLDTPYSTIEHSRLRRASSLKRLLAGTPWITMLRGKFDSPEIVYRKLHTSLLEWQISLYRRDLLGIHVALGYAAKVLVEWNNLNIIAIGVAFGMNCSEILARLTEHDTSGRIFRP
jgi:V/A-type H+-transporting ATPase subunit C